MARAGVHGDRGPRLLPFLLLERWLDEPIAAITPHVAVTFSRLDPAELDDISASTTRCRVRGWWSASRAATSASWPGTRGRIVSTSWVSRHVALLPVPGMPLRGRLVRGLPLRRLHGSGVSGQGDRAGPRRARALRVSSGRPDARHDGRGTRERRQPTGAREDRLPSVRADRLAPARPLEPSLAPQGREAEPLLSEWPGEAGASDGRPYVHLAVMDSSRNRTAGWWRRGRRTSRVATTMSRRFGSRVRRVARDQSAPAEHNRRAPHQYGQEVDPVPEPPPARTARHHDVPAGDPPALEHLGVDVPMSL